MTMPPKSAAIPADLTTGTMTGMKAKLVPWTTGRRAPTGPRPTVWIRVATPAKTMTIWIM